MTGQNEDAQRQRGFIHHTDRTRDNPARVHGLNRETQRIVLTFTADNEEHTATDIRIKKNPVFSWNSFLHLCGETVNAYVCVFTLTPSLTFCMDSLSLAPTSELRGTVSVTFLCVHTRSVNAHSETDTHLCGCLLAGTQRDESSLAAEITE